MKYTLVGIDLAKRVFQVVGLNERGEEKLCKAMSRKKFLNFIEELEPTTVAMEACSSAHHFGREFQNRGHKVKLIHPQFVKPFLMGQKNDKNDARAICAAAKRPRMRFVPVKTIEQQDLRALHKAREMTVRQRTQIANSIRSMLAERGYVARKGYASLRALVLELVSDEDAISPHFKMTLTTMNLLWETFSEQKKTYDRQVAQKCKEIEVCRRLTQIPGIGPICATALVAGVSDAYDFKNGRDLAAWLGLVPKQNSSGGQHRLSSITKRGDRYLRKQLIHGARSVVYHKDKYGERTSSWLHRLSEKSPNIAAVALANRNARIAWSMMKSGENYRHRS